MYRTTKGFTIIELLIVIVVIAILAAITIVAYNGIANQAKESVLKSDLREGATQLGLTKAETDSYPISAGGLKKSDSTLFQYTSTSSAFCMTAINEQSPDTSFNVTESGTITEGLCSGHIANPAKNGELMQTITSANCSTARIRAVDARDNHTYWVQKLPDGKCWMLTNLGYAGGGTNTYGDARTLTDGTSSSTTYTVASYYVIPSTVNYTTEPTSPSVSTDGSGQYGYLYNFCGANGGQAGNSACSNASSTAVNTAVSVCPAGWRLPTGGSGGDFDILNSAINNSASNTDAGMRSFWLAQWAGSWNGSFGTQGIFGYYWSVTPVATTAAYRLLLYNSLSAAGANSFKYSGHSVRCFAI